MMKTKVIQGYTLRYKMVLPECVEFDNCVSTVGGSTLSDAISNLRQLLAPSSVTTIYKAERTNILFPEES